MDSVIAHVQENWVGYIAVVLCIIPFLIIFKKYTTPVLFYITEAAIFTAALHFVLFGITRMARWFKLNSTMYFREKVDPGWNVPLKDFWNWELYRPAWVFYLELALIAAILYLVYRSGTYSVQKPVPKKTGLGGRPPASLSHPRAKKKK